jgi:hypothetical protein
MMGKRGFIFVALVAIGFVLNPVVPVWLFASAVAVLFAAWRILPVRSGQRPLRGASMVHVPAGSEYGPWVCTKPPKPRPIGAGDFPAKGCMPYTPIEITREELDSSEVRYDADPWKKTGGSSSPVSGPLPTTAADPRGDKGDR